MPLPALVAWALLCAWLDATPALAQPTPPANPSEAKPAEAPAPALPVNSQPGLQTYYLRDAQGALVPVVGMSFEEFEALLQLKKGLLPPEPPRYSLDRLSITGTADDQSARVTVSIELRVRGAGWAEIPLGLTQGALLAPPKYTGEGEPWFVADEKLGFRLWIRGEGKPHQVELSFALPVQLSGQVRRVEWTLPRAAETSWKLNVSGKQLVAGSRGGEEGVLLVRNLGGDKHELALTGASGAVQLTWQPGDASQGGRSLIEALGDIRILVEGKNRLRSEAKLKVRDLSQPLTSFRVRLPPGMRLVPETVAGYRVSGIEEKPPSNLGKLIEVQLDRPVSASPAEVQLVAESDPTASDANLRPGRFEVLGAYRQRGAIACAVDGDWLLTWTEDPTVRRTDLSGAAALSARFEYFHQPCELRVTVGSRPSRVIAEPSYSIDIRPAAAFLEAEIRCQVRGARTGSIALVPGAWRIDEVRRETGLKGRLETTTQGAKVLLPLTDSVDELGEARFIVRGQLTTPSQGDAPLRFAPPVVEADVVSPALLALSVAENIVITPRNDELVGLQLEPAASLADKPRAALVYREQGDSPTTFVADLKLLERRLTARSSAQVQIDSRRLQVEQQFAFQVDYEPVSQLTLVGPSGEVELLTLQITRAGDPVEPALTETAPDPSGPRQWTIAFREPVAGPIVLTARYSVSRPAPATSESASPGAAHLLTLPLFVPSGDELDSFRGLEVAVELAADAGEEFAATADSRSLEGDGPEWTVAQTGPGKRTYRALLPAKTLTLDLRPTADLAARQLLIERTWLQTLLAGGVREDHAAWRIRTDRDFVEIRLPPAVDPADLIAAVDGRRAVRAELSESRLRVPLAAAPTKDATRLIELWTRAPRAAGWTGDALVLPSLVGGRVSQAALWEVITPPDELVLLDPPGFAPDMHWARSGLLWVRQPNRDSAQLADWLGASGSAAPPQANRYLFQSLGRPEATHLRLAPQRTLGAALAALGLCGGLLLLYVAPLRSPALLVVVAVTLLGLGWMSVDLALWCAQFALAGGGLALLALALRWLLGSQPSDALPPAPGSTFVRNKRASSITPAVELGVGAPATAPLSTAPPGEVLSTGPTR